MKKYFIFIIMLMLTSNIAYSNNIFEQHEDFYTNSNLPFFVNIYSNDFDIKEKFDEQHLKFTPQVKFMNKKIKIADDKKKDDFFISAYKSKSVVKMTEYESIEVSSKLTYGKWDIKNQITQEIASGENQYYNYLAIEPTYNVNDKLSIFGGLSHSITDNYDQTKLGFRIYPFKTKNFGAEISVSNYTKQYSNYRQKLNFSTFFKI